MLVQLRTACGARRWLDLNHKPKYGELLQIPLKQKLAIDWTKPAGLGSEPPQRPSRWFEFLGDYLPGGPDGEPTPVFDERL
jgi:hypothetical protein